MIKKLSNRIKSCSFPKSNFSLKEQIDAILNIISYFNTVPFSYEILSTFFIGVSFDKFVFASKSHSNENFSKINIISTIPIESFIFIFSQLEKLQINRNFLFSIKNNLLTISDPLLKNSISFNLYYPDTDFIFDSRFFYFFKLNKKTFNKKSKILLSNNFLFILFSRKEETYLFGHTLN